jgi:uncharacterized protein Yka (UPF0111/DUF47 family)
VSLTNGPPLRAAAHRSNAALCPHFGFLHAGASTQKARLMQKDQAVALLGPHRLMLPGWVRAALAANDRLKAYLTVLQTAADHAAHPKRDVPGLGHELAAAGLSGLWLHDFAASATRVDGKLVAAELPRLVKCLADDLALMARPVLDGLAAAAEPRLRVQRCVDALLALTGSGLTDAQLDSLTRGTRVKRAKQDEADSLHLLVMDLHKQINQLASQMASEVIDGANVWELRASDRPRVQAFMRGLNRTAGLKFDHPGLETVATRDGERLLLQNDIGTNDAHVLVLQVTPQKITLTYSDLHRERLEFFQSMLQPFGAQWSGLESRVSAELNAGAAFSVSTGEFICADDMALNAALEGIASRIVFLIDWNRARKRLHAFVSKAEAVALLAEVARLDVGHRAWLQLGGERLIFGAMQAAGNGAFRVGDRLDKVIGTTDAHAFLLQVLTRSRDALQGQQPGSLVPTLVAALVADETRMLLAQQLRHRSSEFDLLCEHAAYCQALAQAVSDALAHGAQSSVKAAQALAARAKNWERKADQLVMQARDKAEQQPRWQPIARLLEQSDDVADALEEAAFLMGLMADHHLKGWNDAVRKALTRLAATVLQATEDHVKALAIARSFGQASHAADNDAFLAAIWRILQAERQCDELLREARKVILQTLQDAPSLMLANDLAVALEDASDRLLSAAYALRDVAFDKAGVRG